MDMDPNVDIEQLVLALLQKRERDYMTVKQIVAGLPSAPRKRLGLTTSQSTAALLGKLTPHLGQGLKVYKGSRSSYIGRNLSPEDLILRRIEQKSGISSKQLGTQLPMAKRPYITVLNALLNAGAVVCTLRENHTPCLMLADTHHSFLETPSVAPEDVGLAVQDAYDAPEDTRTAFKDAYDRVGQGRDFVRIHRLRDALGWPPERFDQVLIDLMADYTVELHGGDPSLLTAADLHDSYTDPHGTLYITLSWRGRP
jgi:hypothetical protein